MSVSYTCRPGKPGKVKCDQDEAGPFANKQNCNERCVAHMDLEEDGLRTQVQTAINAGDTNSLVDEKLKKLLEAHWILDEDKEYTSRVDYEERVAKSEIFNEMKEEVTKETIDETAEKIKQKAIAKRASELKKRLREHNDESFEYYMMMWAEDVVINIRLKNSLSGYVEYTKKDRSIVFSDKFPDTPLYLHAVKGGNDFKIFRHTIDTFDMCDGQVKVRRRTAKTETPAQPQSPNCMIQIKMW